MEENRDASWLVQRRKDPWKTFAPIQPFDTDSGFDSHLIILATVRTEWLLEVIPASWPSGWHSPKFSVSGEILLKGDCAVLSCSLQPVSSTVTKPSREGWNAIWEALFSAGSLAHRVGWKSARGWPHPAPCLQRHPRQLLSVFGFPLGSLNLTCRNHLQRTTVTVMFPSSLAWTPLHNPAAA